MADRIDLLLRALGRVPPWTGMSFRGRPAGAAFGRGRRTAVSRGLVATSRDPRVATENFTTPGLYVVLGTQGRGIESFSQHPEEREVVFLPFTVFGFAATARVDDLEIVVVRQVVIGETTGDPVEAAREAAPTIGRAVVAARRRPAVVVSSPGKFAGDID